MLDPDEMAVDKMLKKYEEEKKKTHLNVNWPALNARSQRRKCEHCTRIHHQSEIKMVYEQRFKIFNQPTLSSLTLYSHPVPCLQNPPPYHHQ